MTNFIVPIDATSIVDYSLTSPFVKALWGVYKLGVDTITYAFDRHNNDFEWEVVVNSLNGNRVIATSVEDAVAKATSNTGIISSTGIDVDVIDIKKTFYYNSVINSYNTIQNYVAVTIRQAAADEQPTNIVAAVDSTVPISGDIGPIRGLSTMPKENASGSIITVLGVQATGSSEKTTPDGGSYPFERALHEILHSVGLKHPHDGTPLLPKGLITTTIQRCPTIKWESLMLRLILSTSEPRM